jgi:CubicO group peptidase (beta-lactamase class C family)
MHESFKKFIDLMQENSIDLKYAQIRQGGEVVDEWSNMPVKTRLNMWSVSKSFISVGIGIAIDEGLITIDDKIADIFPEYVSEHTSQNLLDVRVRDLLTMTVGLENPLFFGDSPERYVVKDWIQYYFNANFTEKPGKSFLYSNFNTYMLSNMIERKAGVRNTLEYLRNRLFELIDIGNPDWTCCPMGHIYAANGLYLTIDELGRFGEMLLRKGEYNNKRIVSSLYIENATKKYIDSLPPPGGGYVTLYNGYGYHFWMTQIPGSFFASGNFGQGCIIVPDKDAVISFMSLEGNNFGLILDKAPEIADGI